MRKNTDDYFRMTRAELEAENRELSNAVAALRDRQAILTRAVDNLLAEETAQLRLDSMSESERIALKKVLV